MTMDFLTDFAAAAAQSSTKDAEEGNEDSGGVLLDTCPVCGEESLVAVCSVIVSYSVTNDGADGQDWERDEVDDDSSNPISFRCRECDAHFPKFELTKDGYLESLGPPED